MEDFEFNKDTDIREYRRLVILRLSEKGMRQADIADVTGCSQGRVSQVLQSYEEHGYSGIESRPHPGAPSRLSQSDERALKAELKKGAKHRGFDTDS